MLSQQQLKEVIWGCVVIVVVGIVLFILYGCGGDSSATVATTVRVKTVGDVTPKPGTTCDPAVVPPGGQVDCEGLSIQTCLEKIEAACDGEITVQFGTEVETTTTGNANTD